MKGQVVLAEKVLCLSQLSNTSLIDLLGLGFQYSFNS